MYVSTLQASTAKEKRDRMWYVFQFNIPNQLGSFLGRVGGGKNLNYLLLDLILCFHVISIFDGP